jgi:hypothetical protein
VFSIKLFRTALVYDGLRRKKLWGIARPACYNLFMFALNFYSDLYGEALRSGRKSATIRLGDKSSKYRTGQVVWVTTGARYARRKKLFCGILDKVEVKPLGEMSPRDIQRENPEFRSLDDVLKIMSQIYGEEVSADRIATIIYFSPIDEYEL